MSDPNSRLVYSTDTGRIKPDREKNRSSKAEGPVRVSFEKAGRKGKGVTIIYGLPLSGEELVSLSKELKQQMGTGGTVREGTIELQGDHRQQVLQQLVRRGYEAK